MPPEVGGGYLSRSGHIESWCYGSVCFDSLRVEGILTESLPTTEGEYFECVRFILSRNVTFVALVDEYMIGGPSSLWVDWQEAASKFQTAKFSMSMTLRQGEICNLIDDELFPGLELNDWNYKLDLRRPIIGLTSQSNVDLLKDPMNFLFQWSQFKDGTFSACLTPEQWRHPITLLDVPEPLLVEGALSTPGESCPAAGLVATLSGGALGLGYSVTKLLS